MDKKRGLKLLIVLSILLLVIFGYLTKLHYTKEVSKFCNISEGISCDIVNKSIYSEIFGIPVAILGLLTFIGVILISLGALKGKKFFIKGYDSQFWINLLLGIMIFNLLFSLWLIYAELYLILSICLFCVISDAIMLVMLYFTVKISGKMNKNLLYAINAFMIIYLLLILYLAYKIIIEL